MMHSTFSQKDATGFWQRACPARFKTRSQLVQAVGRLSIWMFRLLVLSSCTLSWDLVVLQARAQTAAEYKYQAVYLYNFLLFVDWPADAFPSATDPIVIGVLGLDPLGAALDEAVKDEVVKGRRVVVKRFKRIQDMERCHLLYIGRSEKPRLEPIFLRLENSCVLTVSDIDDFTKRGGAVKFFKDNGKLRFEINLVAVKKARITVSSQILKLAKILGAEGQE